MQWCSPIGISTMLPRPVWPVYWTGLTGLPRLSNKLGICEFWMSTYAPCFLVKLAYQETFLQTKTALKQWEVLVHQSHLVCNDKGIRLTTYPDMAQDDGFTLLLIFLHLPWDTNLGIHHFGYDCLEYTSKSISHFKWPWMHKLTQLQWIAISLLSSIITTESV